MVARWLSLFCFLLAQIGHAAPDLGPGFTVTKDSSESFSLNAKSLFPVIENVKSYGDTVVSVKLENFSDIVDEGFYNIPRKIIHVVVPEHKDVIIDVKANAEPIGVSLDYDVELAKPNTHDSNPFYVRRNKLAEQENHSQKLAVIEDVSFAGHYRLATISLWPVSYDVESRKLTHTADFDVQISFIPSPKDEMPAPVSSADRSILAPLVINDWNLPGGESSKLDLIIAHEIFRDSLGDLINFKKQQGRDVNVLFVKDATTSSIKKMIEVEYRKSPAPASTLLIGNIDHIPAWRGRGDNAWTDFPYQTLDSGDVPDIALGRVPALDVGELSAFIAKAIAREVSPPAMGEVLLTAGRDVSLGCPDNVSKVGDFIQSGEADINLIKKFRSRGATKDEIFDAYNAGPNIVVYDGHGNHTGMTEIPLVLDNLSRLSNNSYPIVFDIACLNANWSRGASRRNFAEMILLKKDHGVAGIMASGGSGYGHTFFQTIGKLSAVARRELKLGLPSALNEVGTLILSAKIKHGSQDRSYWNYYGDPATSVWPN